MHVHVHAHVQVAVGGSAKPQNYATLDEHVKTMQPENWLVCWKSITFMWCYEYHILDATVNPTLEVAAASTKLGVGMRVELS